MGPLDTRCLYVDVINIDVESGHSNWEKTECVLW